VTCGAENHQTTDCICLPGYSGAARLGCEVCDAGTYATAGSTTCSACPPNRLSAPGSVDISECICPAGNTGRACAACEPGTRCAVLPCSVSLAVGGTSSCVISVSGELRCWGDNYYGQLGQDDKNSRGDEPGEMGVRLANPSPYASRMVETPPSSLHAVVYPAEPSPERTFLDSQAKLTAVNLGGKAVEVSMGEYHACALLVSVMMILRMIRRREYARQLVIRVTDQWVLNWITQLTCAC